MKWVVGIPYERNGPINGELTRYLLNLPHYFAEQKQGVAFNLHADGQYKVSAARNNLTRWFIDKTNGDVLWQIDSDMDPTVEGREDNFVPQIIEAMGREDVDILTGFYFRMSADGPVPSLAHPKGKDHILEEVFKKPPGLHHVPGLRAGGACLLVKRHVFEDMREKGHVWFRDEWEDEDKEKWGSLKSSEDTVFFHYAQECGHKVWIDTRLVWGHIKPLDMRDELRRSRTLLQEAKAWQP